ncbi:MAG: hypothetical protein WDN24_09400 [Sphingomonas sp.]
MKFADADAVFARDILVAIARAIAVNRSLEAAKASNFGNFWRVIQGGLYDTAIVDWCVLFGSDNPQQQKLHWKNIFEANAFRTALLARLSISLDEWVAYRDMLKIYRDENAAHREINPSPHSYPNMDIALEACFVYSEHLCDIINRTRPGYCKEDLRNEFDLCSVKFEKVARVAVEAIADI